MTGIGTRFTLFLLAIVAVLFTINMSNMQTNWRNLDTIRTQREIIDKQNQMLDEKSEMIQRLMKALQRYHTNSLGDPNP
jgi:hypothetical protein